MAAAVFDRLLRDRLGFAFRFADFFRLPSRRNNYLQPVQGASEEGTSVQCRHRRKNNPRRNQTRKAKGSFTRRTFADFE